MLLATLTLTGQEFSDDLLQKAQQGDPKAQYDLYQCLLYGEDLEYSNDDMDSWLLRAAEGGYALAQYELGKKCVVTRPEIEESPTDLDAGLDAVSSAAIEDGPQYTEEGIAWIRKAAEQDYTPALVTMGDLYFYGNGVAINDSEALKWYQHALAQGEDMVYSTFYDVSSRVKALEGDSEELFELGDLRYIGLAADKGYLPAVQYMGDVYSGVERTVEWLQDDDSHYPVFTVLENPVVENDYVKALKYYKIASQQGDPLSQERATLIEGMLAGDMEATYNLAGLIYQDDDESDSAYHLIDRALLQKIAEKGYAPAQYTLGSYLFNDEAEGEKWLKKSASQHFEGANALLGNFYLYWQRYDDAIKAFNKALKEDEEDMEAVSGLAAAYFGKEEYAEAKPWYELAAAPDEDGDYDQESMMQLGLCYYHLGQFHEAIQKFRLLADGEESGLESNASYYLGLCYLDGHNYAEAMHWFTKSGNAPSYYQMGMMHLEGKGVEKDQEKAISLMREGIEAYGRVVARLGGDMFFDLHNGYVPILEVLSELDVVTDKDNRYRVTELRIVDDDYNSHDEESPASDY